jgi:hypothetical protein
LGNKDGQALKCGSSTGCDDDLQSNMAFRDMLLSLPLLLLSLLLLLLLLLLSGWCT